MGVQVDCRQVVGPLTFAVSAGVMISARGSRKFIVQDLRSFLMKLANFEWDGPRRRGVVGHCETSERPAPALAADMIDLIGQWDQDNGRAA